MEPSPAGRHRRGSRGDADIVAARRLPPTLMRPRRKLDEHVIAAALGVAMLLYVVAWIAVPIVVIRMVLS